jgi:hypothetical protein
MKNLYFFGFVTSLKVPKVEIFNLMDSRDFYTIKPLWVGDFVTVIKIRNCFVLVMISKCFPRKFE